MGRTICRQRTVEVWCRKTWVQIPFLEIPHAHGSIRGTSDKSVAYELKTPDTAFETLQLLKSLP